MVIRAVCRFELHVAFRQTLVRLIIYIEFVVQAAFEFTALPGQFLWIGRNVLLSGRSGRHRLEVFHPGGATEFASARADSADASRFLSRPDLPHLDTYVKGVGQHANQFAKVHTRIGNIVEYRLVAVALIFDVADFHVQLERFGNLSALDHRVVLSAACLLPFFEVCGARFSVDAFDLTGVFGLCLFHLQRHERSGEGNGADVVSGRGFYGHHVSFLEIKVIVVAEIAFARIFKLHFHQVGELVVAGDVAVVVEGVELMFRAPASAGRESAECRVGNGRL